MSRNTYFIEYPRNFSNEYTVAVATDALQARAYRDAEWDRIDRETAIKMMARGGRDGWGTEYYIGVEINGREAYMGRREVARAIRVGETLH